MDWQEEYRRKLISAQEAASLVKSGDYVLFTPGREALAVGLAIAARKEELKNVKVWAGTPGYDFGWYDPGWQDSFQVSILMPTAVCQEAVDSRRVDINPGTLVPFTFDPEEKLPDIVLAEVSPPDDKGFCSFGQSVWNKKRLIKDGKLAIAEVNQNLIRTYGDNFIHISEIDYLVEHISSGGAPGLGSLAGRALKEPEPYLQDIAQYVSRLVKDGDTIQIGVGRTTEPLVRLGMLEGKEDLGYHSEATPPGIISLVREGRINGRRKTLNPGTVVVTSIGGSTREEMQWVDHNPLFHLVDVAYLEDIRIISAHDNMVAINQALIIDLTGQASAEAIGARWLSTPGGQPPFVLGALMSKGGRSITVLPSTAQGGTVSRIVPMLPPGTAVTIPRYCTDFVVTEYGIARLKGKSLRRRADELIAIAHPDFRAELKKEAQKLLYP